MLFEKEYCELKQYKEGYLEDKVTYKYTLSTSLLLYNWLLLIKLLNFHRANWEQNQPEDPWID